MRRDFALSPEEKIDARAALALLAGSGLTLTDAARLALHLKPQAAGRHTVAEGVEAYFKAAVKRRMKSGTLEFYQSHLDAVVRRWGEDQMDAVERADLRRWLEALPLAPDTVRGRLRAARAMWRWCLRQDPPLASRDPTEGLQLELEQVSTQDRFLEPGEVRRVMEGAGIYTAALACVFFAGVRIEEVRARRDRKPPLTWGNVDFGGRFIRVEAGKDRHAPNRIQEDLPDNFWAWMERGRRLLIEAGHPGGAGDPVCPFEVKQAWSLAKGILGHWPKNAHRHSFITYHVALFKDTGRTSELIGHQGRVQLLHSRYKGRVAEAAAREYFAIVPQ